jgi:hypothetical protein
MEYQVLEDQVKAVRSLAMQAYQITVAEPLRANRLDDLACRINLLKRFVDDYEWIDDPSIRADDEVINWTFPDVTLDFANAVWNLACGFYKASGSSARSAYDLSVLALFFLIKQNREPSSYVTKVFDEWDRGDIPSPPWEGIKNVFTDQGLFRDFNSQHNCDVIKESRDHYRVMSSFAHSRPFAPVSRLPTNNMSLPFLPPRFDASTFDRFADLLAVTIGWVATMWLLSYPEILTRQASHHPVQSSTYRPLFVNPRGKEAFAFVTR